MRNTKTDSFADDITVVKQHEAELTTKAMLLGAEWSPNLRHFVKTDRGVSPDGIPWHWKTYYDRDGNEVSNMNLAKLGNSR